MRDAIPEIWARYAKYWRLRQCPYCRAIRPITGSLFCSELHRLWLEQVLEKKVAC
jgi:hypothetical protein